MTPSQERGRARLILRIPHLRAIVDQVTDEAFLDILESYDLACQGLEYWTRSEGETRDIMIAEYTELMAALEADAELCAGRVIEERTAKQ